VACDGNYSRAQNNVVQQHIAAILQYVYPQSFK